jgi:hypothetical protein
MDLSGHLQNLQVANSFRTNIKFFLNVFLRHDSEKHWAKFQFPVATVDITEFSWLCRTFAAQGWPLARI